MEEVLVLSSFLPGKLKELIERNPFNPNLHELISEIFTQIITGQYSSLKIEKYGYLLQGLYKEELPRTPVDLSFKINQLKKEVPNFIYTYQIYNGQVQKENIPDLIPWNSYIQTITKEIYDKLVCQVLLVLNLAHHLLGPIQGELFVKQLKQKKIISVGDFFVETDLLIVIDNCSPVSEENYSQLKLTLTGGRDDYLQYRQIGTIMKDFDVKREDLRFNFFNNINNLPNIITDFMDICDILSDPSFNVKGLEINLPSCIEKARTYMNSPNSGNKRLFRSLLVEISKHFPSISSLLSEFGSIKGQIRVGRIKWQMFKKTTYPSYPNFTFISVVSKSKGEFKDLSPFFLKNENGVIFENYWQFSKVYPQVPEMKDKLWKWPMEIHMENGEPNQLHWKWMQAGYAYGSPVRYPVGRKNKGTVAYSVKIEGNSYKKLDYVQSRKEIYLPEYVRLVKKSYLFRQLVERYEAGENLLIGDVDGPHQESLGYYQQKYGVGSDFIINDSMLADRKNMDIMLNDPKHPFGHGYCLAGAILGYW